VTGATPDRSVRLEEALIAIVTPRASVYDRFTEGFATADMQAARALLDELPP
jgi:hypothetical protein